MKQREGVKACSPVWPLSDQRGGDKWLQHSSLSALVGRGGKQPSYRELHHPNNIILFMRLVDRSRVWLAWGSAQVNWKPELCNGTGSWADIVPLVITQEACVSVYRLHLRFMALVWEWNIRGQVMDVAINGTEGAEMGHLYHRKKKKEDAQRNALKHYIVTAYLISISCVFTQSTYHTGSFEVNGINLIYKWRCVLLFGMWQVYLPSCPSSEATETLCLFLSFWPPHSLVSFWSRAHSLH